MKTTMEEDRPFKSGYLLTPPQGKLLKRTWQKKYYALHKASSNGIERVEVFDSEEAFKQNSKSRKMIVLNECIKVAQAPLKNQQNVFEVITKSQVHQFSAETTQDLAEWVLALQQVAFVGGQRRDMGPTTPPTPLSYSRGGSQKSTGIPASAEEENQIYGSFGGPQAYLVRVVESDSSLACGLISGGSYLLVVSPIQLVLLEEGASIHGKKHLLAFPYRHIRRYGRGKGTFTFEAGRKCATGEGTFTFETSESNSIFQGMQANTRTLKREEEDAALLTPGIIMNRAANSWPSVDESSFESKSALAGDLERARLSDPKENKTILDRVLSRNKTHPPFAKPPRKSKFSSAGSLSEPHSEPIRLELSSLARAKLAESSASQPLPLEPTYSVPEQRMEAWKMFARETDNIHEEKTPDAYDDENYEVIPLTPGSKYANVAEMWSPTKKEMPPKILAAKRTAAADSSYDHLCSFVVSQPPVSPVQSPDGHIYSRLNALALPDPEVPPTQKPEEAVGRPPVLHDYDEPTEEEREEIKRFLQNDEVYTVVTKSPKRGTSKPSAI